MTRLSRFLAVEAGVSAAINGALSAGFATLLFSGRGLVPAFGSGGFAPDFLVQTFVVVLMSVTVPSLIAQARLRSGGLAPLSAASAGPLWRRALIAALALAVGLGGAAMLLSLTVPSLAFPTLLAIKVAYGAVLAAIVTPWALGRVVARA